MLASHKHMNIYIYIYQTCIDCSWSRILGVETKAIRARFVLLIPERHPQSNLAVPVVGAAANAGLEARQRLSGTALQTQAVSAVGSSAAADVPAVQRRNGLCLRGSLEQPHLSSAGCLHPTTIRWNCARPSCIRGQAQELASTQGTSFGYQGGMRRLECKSNSQLLSEMGIIRHADCTASHQHQLGHSTHGQHWSVACTIAAYTTQGKS